MKLRFSQLCLSSLLWLALPGLAWAQHDAGASQPEDFESLYPGKAYSPWAQRSFPSQVYWGETHLHTGLSLDAGLFGNTVGHDDAYRLARDAVKIHLLRSRRPCCGAQHGKSRMSLLVQ